MFSLAILISPQNVANMTNMRNGSRMWRDQVEEVEHQWWHTMRQLGHAMKHNTMHTNKQEVAHHWDNWNTLSFEIPSQFLRTHSILGDPEALLLRSQCIFEIWNQFLRSQSIFEIRTWITRDFNIKAPQFVTLRPWLLKPSDLDTLRP